MLGLRACGTVGYLRRVADSVPRRGRAERDLADRAVLDPVRDRADHHGLPPARAEEAPGRHADERNARAVCVRMAKGNELRSGPNYHSLE